MKSIASAPGKIILAGEHFVIYGTKSILCSINKRVTVISEFKKEKTITIISNIESIETSLVSCIRKDSKLKPFLHIVKKIFLRYGYCGGIQVIIDSGIPVGIGLGSSSACCIAVAASVLNLFKKNTIEDIIKIAIDGEKTIFKNTSGADCTVCGYGGIIEYNKIKHKKINVKSDLCLIIINSMTTHSTNLTVKKVKEFKKNNEKYFYKLCNAESQLIKKIKIALTNGDLDVIGECMSKNQIYLEEIGVSNNEIQNLINTVKKVSYGAKITGAGDGGCIVILTSKKKVSKIISNLNKKYQFFPIEVEYRGVIIGICS